MYCMVAQAVQPSLPQLPCYFHWQSIPHLSSVGQLPLGSRAVQAGPGGEGGLHVLVQVCREKVRMSPCHHLFNRFTMCLCSQHIIFYIYFTPVCNGCRPAHVGTAAPWAADQPWPCQC